MSVDVNTWRAALPAHEQQTSTTQNLGDPFEHQGHHWTRSVATVNAHFSDLWTRMADLLNRATDEESGFVPPSREAVLRGLVVLSNFREMPTFAGISDDGEGGLEVYWMGASRHVQLNVPARPHQPLTLFWDGAGSHRLERLTALGTLADRLRWLTEE